jgi:hypothetical protein
MAPPLHFPRRRNPVVPSATTSPDGTAATEPVLSRAASASTGDPAEPPEAGAASPADRPDDGDPATEPGGTRPAGPDSAIHQALARWRADIEELAGASTLADITQLGGALVDLTQAHPSGIAQLYAGRPTRLSNLVRESTALTAARRAARAVLQRAEEFSQRFATAPIYLVIGIGHWADLAGDGPEPDIRLVHAPLMLRPLRLMEVEGPEADFELQLDPGIEMNPEFVSALHRAGATPDLEALAAMSVTEHGFSPRATLTRLGELGRLHLADFDMSERIHVGPFLHPGQILLDDLAATDSLLLAHPVVAALAGDIEAKRALAEPLPATSPFDRAPDAERGVGDLDPVQQGVIDQVVSGRSIFVDARAGSQAPETIAAILADAAASGRSVVYVPGSRRTGRATIRVLADAGLGDLVLDLQESQWRATAAERLRSGLQPWEDHLDDDAVRRMRATLLDVRSRLESYTAALHHRRDPWGISAYDALQHLADLTASASGPSTHVRLDGATVARLGSAARATAAEDLTRLAVLGGFSVRRHDTPWFGAHVSSAKEATRALELTQVLSEMTLPQVISDVGRVTRETGLERAGSLSAWLEQIEMLKGIRESLDVFTPVIFERSAADMVIATATPQWRREHGADMSSSTRRRLTKQARDLVRPGRPVEDLHAALARVQKQREVWRRHCPAGGWPRVPQGLGDLERTANQAREQVAELTPAFDDDFLGMGLEKLRDRLLELGRDPSALRYLPEINVINTSLRQRGLGPLIEDLRERRLDPDAAAAELELAWWASVLDSILRSDSALAGYDGATLNRLADHFRALDRAQVTSLPGPVRRAVGRRLGRVIASDKVAAQELWRELSRHHLTNVRSLRTRFPDLLTAVRPVWVVPPMLVGQVLPPRTDVDLLVVDGAQHLPTANVVAAIARARQVVLVGDSSREGPGIVDELTGTLPAAVLPTDRAQREEHIAAFLAGHGYDGVVDSVPARPTPSTLRLHLVEGFGMPAVGAVAVEGVDTEVSRVLDLVRAHAQHPEGSLAVVSLSSVTAQRIRGAIRQDGALARLLEDPERFTVTDVEDVGGLRYDTVLLSVGFAKTPHGRVLHRFGPVSSPEGLSLVVDLLDTVRHNLHIVSCLAPEDLERDRLGHAGAHLLADLLDLASDSPAEPGSSKARSQPAEGEPDLLLHDLTGRLRRIGLTVVPRYGFEGGVRLPLAVGHPDRPGELFVGVLTDDDAYVAEPSLRRRDRLWVERLEQHGWTPHMAFSTAVFLDPQREATAIAAKVTAAMAATPRPTTVRAAEWGELADEPVSDESGADEAASGEPVSDEAVADDLIAATEQAVAAEPAVADEPADVAEPADAAGVADAEEDPGAEPAVAGTPDRGDREEPMPLRPGLDIREYTDDQLDELADWVSSDGAERTIDELATSMRTWLEVTRRGARVDEAFRTAAERHVAAAGAPNPDGEPPSASSAERED